MKLEIKVGDFVVICKDSNLTDYYDGRLRFFEVAKIITDGYSCDVCFPFHGNGAYMKDLRLATKLEKAMK